MAIVLLGDEVDVILVFFSLGLFIGLRFQFLLTIGMAFRGSEYVSRIGLDQGGPARPDLKAA